jgi:hypothetical protein
MLTRSRLVLGLCGLALAVPALPAVASPDDGPSAAATAPVPQPAAGAQTPILLDPTSGYRPTSALQPQSAPAPAPVVSQPAAAMPHRHKGLFGWKHCVECQRARVKQQDGVDVPPPPGQPGMAVQGEMVMTGPVVITDSHGEVIRESQEGGFAVVGPGSDPSAPGVAVVGGSASAEPAPIGVARSVQNPWADPRMAAMSRPPGAGSYDASVVPSSIPAAPQAMSGPGHDRPHIISHVLGLPQVGRLRREREEKQRQQHAAIVYGDPNQKVNELPASMVYSKGSR